MSQSDEAPRVRVVRRADASMDTAQTEGIVRMVTVDEKTVGAKKLWFGLFKNFPGADSGRHHHGEAETAAYISSGHFRVYFGHNYEEFVDLGAGDTVFIPPYLPHLEMNVGTEPAEGLLARSPSNIVVSLEDDAPAEAPDGTFHGQSFQDDHGHRHDPDGQP